MVGRAAEGSDEDVAAVVTYLTRNFGKPVKLLDEQRKNILF
jgi:hypothetical protein